MKKFLSLVLALVMTMSLVTVSAGAKDFTDNSKINYKEAVDVMSAVKVIDGYAEGDFRPANTLTRGAAAKIICNLILGPTTAEALVANAAPYSDVPTTNTFAGYIAYCAKEGIISGYADGTFRPAATLTGYAFMKMLLGALGYDAETEGYTGNNWSIQVAKRALSDKVDLADGLNGEFNGIKAITREEACLYAFNTLKAPMVEYANSNSVTVNGITFTNKSDAKEIERNELDKDGDVTASKYVVADGLLNFGEKYFTKLTVGATSADDYGRPAHQWKYDKKSVGTYADTPDLVYTAGVKGTDLADDLDDADLKIAANVEVIRNGGLGDEHKANSTYTKDQVKATLKTSSPKLGGNGIVLEIYSNDNDEVNTVVAIVNYLAKVESLGKDKASTKSIDERNIKASIGDKTYTLDAEDDIDGFDSVYDNVKKGDYVLITPNGDNSKSTTALSVSVPETVTGSLSYFKTTEKVKVGGTTYDTAKTYAQGALGGTFTLTKKNVTLYLDAYGYVAGYEGPSSTDDKAVAVLKAYKSLNDDGELVDMIKGVTSNGETVTWETANVYTNLNKDTVYTYTEDDDVYSLTCVTDKDVTVEDGATVYLGTVNQKASAKSIPFGNGKLYFDDNVKFIFVNDGKANVKDGVQKVAGFPAYATISQDDDDTYYITALYVIGDAGASSTTSDEIVFVKKNATGELQVTVDGKDKTYYTYDAYINGEKIDSGDGFYAKSSDLAQGFYSVEVEDASGAYLTSGNRYTTTTGKLAAVEGKTVASFAGDLMGVGSADYDLGNAVIADLRSGVQDADKVDNVSDLKDLNKANYTVSFLFDDDDNAVSYLYILDNK